MSRVAFVIMDVGPVGGMERQATEVLRGLVADGHDVTVVARTCDDVPGVRFVRVPTPSRPFSFAFPLWIAWASVVVARMRADVVHVNGAIVINRADIVTVHFCHHAYQSAFSLPERTRSGVAHRLNALVVSAMMRWMERWCLRPDRAQRVIAISAGVGREVQQWFPGRAESPRVIPYGVDSDRFRPSKAARSRVRHDLGLNADALLAVFVGGEWERKGLGHAVVAVGQRPRWHLAVAGAGDRDAYEALAVSHGAADRVHFLGRIDPSGLYGAGDAFVFPTGYETFSLATHEAAAAGLPLLVTRVHGPDELIDPGISGWFVERDGDSIGARLSELETDAQLGPSMGAAARRAAAPLTWDRARRDHALLYREVLDDVRPQGAASSRAPRRSPRRTGPQERR